MDANKAEEATKEEILRQQLAAEYERELAECHARIDELRRKKQEQSEYDFLKMFRIP